MAFDKKEIALSAVGILASAAVAFLIYRLQQNDAAQAAANAANASAESESELANQQAEVASLPSVSVPSITTASTTPSTTDTTNQATAPASDSDLESIITAFMADDNQSTVTSQQTPIASIPVFQLPQQVIVPTVTVPNLDSFYSGTAIANGSVSNNPTPVGGPVKSTGLNY